MNEFTTAIFWKDGAVEPDAMRSIAIRQLSNRPLTLNLGTANRLCGVLTTPGVGDDLRRQ
jgi:hypothetical protein